jgi:hypothetical protein
MKVNDKELLDRYGAGERDFHKADLIGANLGGAILRGADLIDANLTGADLSNANLDLSAWPLWCGSFGLGRTDDRLVAQLLRHTREVAQLLRHTREVARACDSEYGRAVLEALRSLDKFHEYRGDVGPMEAL